MSNRPTRPISPSTCLALLLIAAASAASALALCRVLAEAFHRTMGWLAAPAGTFSLAAVLVALLLLFWRRQADGRPDRALDLSLACTPLFLPLLYLFQERVGLLPAVVWLAGGASLSLLLVVLTGNYLILPGSGRRWQVGATARAAFPAGLLALTSFGIFVATLGRTVGRADTFEFQVVAEKLGIAHPTGYPLYLLLGKLFTLLPVSTVAFRVNLLSAVCAAGAVLTCYAILRQLALHRALSLLAAAALAFSPTFWSQAVEAEVYALNALLVAGVLWGLVALLAAPNPVSESRVLDRRFLVYLVLLGLGLGLANHLTTAIVIPGVALALLLARPRLRRREWLVASLLLVAGLLFYLYLPLRWPAVNDGRLMTAREFVDWVIGGRFKGALQLAAWRTDLTRYPLVGRLVLDQWGWPGVALAALGLVWLLKRRGPVALVTLVTWLGYCFYSLVYHVPDISVFLIPAHLVMAVWMGCGVGALVRWRAVEGAPNTGRRVAVLAALLAILPLSLIGRHWTSIDRSAPNPLEAWGQHVLSLELDRDAAILADSEKIAPLYYLQQTEGLRADLEIMVLPDEAAYRAELDARVARGQTVYLARFLPRLEGTYYLSSAGPLVAVSARPTTNLPPLDGRLDVPFGDRVVLLGYQVQSWQVAYPDPVDLTLFWTAGEPVAAVYQVWLRLADAAGNVCWQSEGAHPAGNSYPTSAWRPGEIIADSHQLTLPAGLPAGEYRLQVALRVPFGSAGLMPVDQADPWLTLGNVTVNPPRTWPPAPQAIRIWLDGHATLVGVDSPRTARPAASLSLSLYSDAAGVFPLQLGWDGSPGAVEEVVPPLTDLALVAPEQGGPHLLVVSGEGPMRCGWLRRVATRCSLARVDVRGAPLPAGATNFQDLFALTAVDVADLVLQPGGMLDVTLTWQALAPIAEDYTLFVHLLDPSDRIVGQVDTWPVQGTYPTSRWSTGRTVTDRLHVPVAPEAAPGVYRLEIGWYLLGSMQRLRVLDSAGGVIDDRVLLEGLAVR